MTAVIGVGLDEVRTLRPAEQEISVDTSTTADCGVSTSSRVDRTIQRLESGDTEPDEATQELLDYLIEMAWKQCLSSLRGARDD